MKIQMTSKCLYISVLAWSRTEIFLQFMNECGHTLVVICAKGPPVKLCECVLCMWRRGSKSKRLHVCVELITHRGMRKWSRSLRESSRRRSWWESCLGMGASGQVCVCAEVTFELNPIEWSTARFCWVRINDWTRSHFILIISFIPLFYFIYFVARAVFCLCSYASFSYVCIWMY